MRLRERDKRDIILRESAGMDDDVYTWGEETQIRAAVYPAGTRLDPRIYGERTTDMRLMLYEGDVTLCPGMGVAMDGSAPQYRIVSVERWAHQSAVLECIPQGRCGYGRSD